MVRQSLCFASFAALVACGTSADPTPAAPAACEVSLADEVSLVEGGSTSVELTLDGPVSELAPLDGFAGRVVLEGTSLRLRPDYGTGDGSSTLSLAYDCGDEAATQALDLSVRSLRWSPLPAWTEGDDGPRNREYGAMWLDPVDQDAFFAFGGFHYRPSQFTPANELWRYDLAVERWTRIDAPDAPFRPGASVALVDGAPHLFGGLAGNDTPSSLFRIDTESTPTSFTEVALAHQGDATGDYQPSFIYDAPRDRLIAACGANNAWGTHCRVRVIDLETGAVTQPEITGPSPEGRGGHFWVHDAQTERLIVFSGFRSGGISGDTFFDDTWALELAESPMRWVQLATGDEGIVEGRRNGVFVLDPVGHRMFVWGGTPDGSTSAPGLYALDLERGHETWEEVSPQGDAPPARASGHGIYDANRARIVAGFGNGDGGLFGDLWALSL